ncbi:hypothetical protein EON63_13320 [archaeon]|nr:MAG: hypothetical protein EON63_13320 [archaeon]
MSNTMEYRKYRTHTTSYTQPTSMNLVRIDAVSVEVPATLYGVHLALDLDFVALHYLLDFCADLPKLHVDACLEVFMVVDVDGDKGSNSSDKHHTRLYKRQTHHKR